MVCTCLSDDRLPLALSYLYQGEKSALVRRFYLLVAMATCHIQPAVWPVYLDSGLPMEIIREIRSSDVGGYISICFIVKHFLFSWFSRLC